MSSLDALAIATLILTAGFASRAHGSTCGGGDGGIAAYPGRGAVDVPLNAQVALFFDHTLWGQGVLDVSLRDESDASVAATAVLVGNCCGNVLLRPDASLQPDAGYRALWRAPPAPWPFDAGPRDIQVTEFRTGAGADLAPPTLPGVEWARYWGRFASDPSPYWHFEFAPAMDDRTPPGATYFRVFIGRDGGSVDSSDAGALLPPHLPVLGEIFCLGGSYRFETHEVLNVGIEAVDWAGNGSDRFPMRMTPTRTDGGYLYPDGGEVNVFQTDACACGFPDAGDAGPAVRDDGGEGATDAGAGDAGTGDGEGAARTDGAGCSCEGASVGSASFAVGLVLAAWRRRRAPTR